MLSASRQASILIGAVFMLECLFRVVTTFECLNQIVFFKKFSKIVFLFLVLPLPIKSLFSIFRFIPTSYKEFSNFAK